MFSSKLFWKVTFYFALLLIILSATTGVTLYFLTQIQQSYEKASIDMTTTSHLERMRWLIVNIQSAADDYLNTGLPEKRFAYDVCWKEFDNELAILQKMYSDSTDLQTLRQVRTSFYDWIKNIGDKKILLYSSAVNSDKLAQTIQALNRQQSSANYLETARGLIQSLYQQRAAAIPKNIDYAIAWTKNIATFIMVVNIILAFFAIALGVTLSRSITKPVGILRDGTQNIMKGVFEPISMKRHDEFGMLASDFNHMSQMLQQNYSRLTAYSELMTALNKHETVANVEQVSLEILCTHINTPVGAIYLLDTNSNTLNLVSGYALNTTHDKTEYKMGEGIPGQCAANRQSIEINDLVATKDFLIDTGIVQAAPSYVLATPILFQENLIGVVVLGSMIPFTDMKREIINNSVPQIGVAITNAINLESTKTLSQEIATKNSELNGKNTELQKAYRVKSDFLSNMSHELRTPLNSIIGFTSVLLGPHGESLTPDQKKALEKVLKNGKHLLELINDILDFSKIEAGRTPINMDSDEVSNVISNVLITVEPMVTTKGVKLVEEIEPDLPILNTDILKVKQILLNLLSNAAKFTEEGSITITAKKQGSMISIAVKDEGIGIEAKNLRRVFEEFQQIDSSSSRKYQGTGLGLAIAKNYASILGGNLTVQSEIGKGSTFTLVIPPVFAKENTSAPNEETQEEKSALKKLSAPASDLKPAPEKSVVPSSGILILCIDDDAEVIDLLRRYLIPEGYSVQGASSGDEGIRLAQQLHPAVITLDIMMPEKDGWQVLRDLKNHPATKDIPVIIHSIIENRPLALSLGALEVVTKPSEPRKVLSVVERACRSKNQPILIVDDNQDFADTMKILLETEGYRATALYSGEEALQEIENINPSVLFLDLLMPGMDGFRVIQKLRGMERWNDLPIVILSGAEITNEQRNDLNKVTQDIIEKGSFSKELISSTIKKTIAHSHR